MSEFDMTNAKVLKIETGDAITLPSDFVGEINEDYGLAILVMKDHNVKLYPVKSSEVSYLRLEIQKLSKSFLEELTMVFEQAGLEDILFTSGICQSEDECYYECYFIPKQLKISSSKMRDLLDDIPGVKKVLLQAVPVGGE
ncbi:MAG: hypothetical protein KGY80_11290 [Candidatus Thorarchaeota archaeon]|nr:hypothetical protein [Candidatus Thorarchaeota archaeon]